MKASIAKTLVMATLYSACASRASLLREVDCNTPEILIVRDSQFLTAVVRIASFNNGRVPIVIHGPVSRNLLSDPRFTFLERDDVEAALRDTTRFYYMQVGRTPNADTTQVSMDTHFFYTREGHRLGQGDGFAYVVRRSGGRCTYGPKLARVQ